ncbi:MAG: dTDP-4-dehydrorhamnose reductase [Bacteroidales bacterium]|nr:dTDP-4-dehydrorhamnose reductase [Bacteroidales bacterium]MBR5862921.1 dTDP-4-dehydrorhamnose reductase [Bacteroidales bacterium]
MKVLVTGGLGQLGREISKLTASSEHTYIYTDVRADGDVVRLDITDSAAVGALVQDVDVIVNCAAYTDVNKAESDADAAYKVNALAPAVLAEAAKAAGAMLIHVSTDYVFDGESNVPYTEDAPKNPLGVYGRTKLAGENAIIASGCRHLIFRTSWLYSNSGKNFFLTMAELTASKPEVKVVEDQVGTPTYAYDLAYLITYIIEENLLDRNGVYNYSGEGVCSWYDFATEICSQLGHICCVIPCRTEDYPSPVKRPHYSVLDKTKVKADFGLEIPYWRQSLAMAVKEYFSLNK